MKTSLSVALCFCTMISVFSEKHTLLPDCPLDDDDVFPDSFVFGAASSAYQIEGAWNKDGKGPSVWDTAVHDFPEKILDRSNGDIAADSYHKYMEDIKALNETGFQSYRFSIAWSRVMPSGEISTLNKAGVDYYHRLIDALLATGIKPVVTMFHWDTPQAVQDLGGFLSPIFMDYFEDYADFLYREYGDKVKDWITFNEPIEICDPCYGHAAKPPYIQAEANGGEYVCANHLVIAHARAYHLYNEKYRQQQGGRVGITVSSGYLYPADKEDYANAERGMQYTLGLFAHPIFSKEGGFPAVLVEEIGRNSAAEGRLKSRLPEMDEEMKAYVRGTSDFFGLNYYTANLVEYKEPSASESPSLNKDRSLQYSKDPEWETAKSFWLHRVPEGFRDTMNFIKNEYDNPEILITENGWSDEGELDDALRVRYFREHLRVLLQVLKCDGVNLTEYYAWSIIDNFEWMVGYTERFGLYNIDFNDPNRPRTAKDSAKFFAEVIKTRQVKEN